MTIESATFLHNLNASYPANADQMGEGDDHIRQMKLVLKNTFPGRAGAEGRAIVKNGAFTPASTESGCLYVTLAEVTCTLPALAGVADGTHYEFKALTNPLTIAPYSGSEYLDHGGNRVIPAGEWAIVAKVDATRWVVFTAPMLSASAITSVLGATAVQNATSADLLDGLHASSFVRTVGGAGPDGSGNVATGGFSVNYANSAGSATNSTQLGWVDSSAYARVANAATDHNHTATYAPMTAIVELSNAVSSSFGYVCTATRANGSTFTFRTTNIPPGGSSCVHAHSLISMAEGKTMFACDVRPGDYVMTLGGAVRVVGVKAVALGMRPLIQVNKTLVLTPDHIVLTTDGFAVYDPEMYAELTYQKVSSLKTHFGMLKALGGAIPPEDVQKLQVGMEVATAGGPVVVVSLEEITTVDREEVVYSFLLEGSSYYLADGYAVAALEACDE